MYVDEPSLILFEQNSFSSVFLFQIKLAWFMAFIAFLANELDESRNALQFGKMHMVESLATESDVFYKKEQER